MEEQLIETWNIHNRVNLYLLAAIPPDALGVVSSLNGRTVFQLFAHMHNVRLMWLKEAAPELLEGLVKVEGASGTHEQLGSELEGSGAAVGTRLRKRFDSEGRIR